MAESGGGEGRAPAELPVRLGRSVGLTYDKREDRIRVYINTQNENEERVLLLTRRLVLPLVMNVMRYAREGSEWAKGGPKEAASSLFDAERRMSLAMTQNSMSKRPQDKVATRGTGGAEAALVVSIRFRKADAQKQLMLLVTDTEQVAVPLSRRELLRLMTMLGEAVEKGRWVALPSSRKIGTKAE